jgi:hypothetical protein
MVMQLAFEQVMDRYSDRLHESRYIFGGRPVRIRVVGHEIAKSITKPFSHLQVDEPDRDPELIIDVWDESETGVRCQSQSTNGERRFIKTTAVAADGRLIGQQLRNVLSCYNHGNQHIISSARWSDQLSVYERCKPFARPLLEWHNDKNIQIIHGSLISDQDKGILFGGKSGSGKSTSALVCLCAGFKFLSEDYVGLQQRHDGSFLGYSLYNSVFLKVADLARFPSFGPYIMKGLAHEEKCAVVLAQVFPDRLARVVPIRAIVLPRIVDTTRPKFYYASKGDALLALGPSSLLQIPSRRLGAHGFSRVAQLIEKTPCYWLELGGDPTSIPDLVGEILSEVS